MKYDCRYSEGLIWKWNILMYDNDDKHVRHINIMSLP